MHNNKIKVGGTYRVRFSPGVFVEAMIVDWTEPKALPHHKGTPHYTYTARLCNAVGDYPRGHEFAVTSRAVVSQVGAPTAFVQRPTKPKEVPAPTQTSPEPSRRSVDTSTVTQEARVHLTLRLPIADLATVLALLGDYKPQITNVFMSE